MKETIGRPTGDLQAEPDHGCSQIMRTEPIDSLIRTLKLQVTETNLS